MPTTEATEQLDAASLLDLPLNVAERGTGSPVILLHSGGMSSRQWKRLGDLLEADHRVLAVDLLGSGANPPWPTDVPLDFSLDVAAVGRILDGLGEPAHLVGHSYGGLIAVTLARLHPELVRSVAAYDPVAFGVLHGAGDVVGLADLAGLGENPLFTDPGAAGTEAWLELFVDWWQQPGAWQALTPAGRDAFLATGRIVFGGANSLMLDHTPGSAYASVTAPALFITGELTPVAARRVVDLLTAAFPHATRVEIQGAGHMGPISHSAAVNEALAAHLAAAS